jgi:hypothetical protein
MKYSHTSGRCSYDLISKFSANDLASFQFIIADESHYLKVCRGPRLFLFWQPTICICEKCQNVWCNVASVAAAVVPGQAHAVRHALDTACEARPSPHGHPRAVSSNRMPSALSPRTFTPPIAYCICISPHNHHQSCTVYVLRPTLIFDAVLVNVYLHASLSIDLIQAAAPYRRSSTPSSMPLIPGGSAAPCSSEYVDESTGQTCLEPSFDLLCTMPDLFGSYCLLANNIPIHAHLSTEKIKSVLFRPTSIRATTSLAWESV